MELLPLALALAPFHVSVRTGRRLVRDGKLPATKIGREYLVSPDDVRALLTPTSRATTPKPKRESESARVARQLSEAGIQ
jgi:excisionase family DNA binding protein